MAALHNRPNAVIDPLYEKLSSLDIQKMIISYLEIMRKAGRHKAMR